MILYGVKLNENRNIYIELFKIYGIGKYRSYLICKKLCLFNRLVCTLSSSEITNISNLLDSYSLGTNLRIIEINNINKLIRIGCYRGIRHLKKLPVRGQRTRTNSRTARKLLFNDKI